MHPRLSNGFGDSAVPFNETFADERNSCYDPLRRNRLAEQRAAQRATLPICTMDDPNNPYPALNFLVKHGKWLPPSVAGAAVLAGLLVAFVSAAWWAVPVGVAAGAFLYLVMCSYVELVRVIVDMLLPK